MNPRLDGSLLIEASRCRQRSRKRVKIRTRTCVSVDGYVTTPDGWPVQLADPNWSPEAYGFREFQAGCEAVLMGRTTFEPALGAEE